MSSIHLDFEVGDLVKMTEANACRRHLREVRGRTARQLRNMRGIVKALATAGHTEPVYAVIWFGCNECHETPLEHCMERRHGIEKV